MQIEGKIIDYVHSTTFKEIPPEAVKTIKNMVLDVMGTSTAGSEEVGVKTLREFYVGLEGKKEATIFIKVAEQLVHNAFNFLVRCKRSVQNFLELVAEGFETGCFHGFQQFFFALKMDVETSLGQPGLGSNLIHGDFSGSRACHKVHHSLLNGLPGYLVEQAFSLCF